MKRLFGWLSAIGAVVIGGLSYAAGQPGERMKASEEVESMLADLTAAAEKLPPQSPVREAIEAGKLDEARQMLNFRPFAEAPVPEGFPAFTPVGVIEVKQYPAYRKATGSGFWPLFQHIQSEKIPMTAPVEMKRFGGESGRFPMAFLYQNVKVGELGEAGAVTVVDSQATTAVSLGIRGRLTDEVAADARKRLEAWLKLHAGEYRAVEESPFRLFGYNGPGVRNRDKFWEAQLVIEPLKTDEADAATTPDTLGSPG